MGRTFITSMDLDDSEYQAATSDCTTELCRTAEESNPVTGRASRKSRLVFYTFLFIHPMMIIAVVVSYGSEELTMSPDGNTLYALLQSATIQYGGNKESNALLSS